MKAVSTILFVVTASLATACAHDPARHLQPNGVAPTVAVDVQERNVWVTDTVGTAEHRDANGVLTGTTAITQDRVAGREKYVAGWKLMRGDQELDAVDYYHLAGDDRTANEIERYRHRGLLYNHIGLGLLAAGIGGAVLMTTTSGAPAKIGVTAFTIGTPVGGIMALMGVSRAKANPRTLDHALGAVNQPMPYVGPVNNDSLSQE